MVISKIWIKIKIGLYGASGTNRLWIAEKNFPDFYFDFFELLNFDFYHPVLS